MGDELQAYFSGEKLYGDDFSAEEIQQWFADESEGYANLGSKDRGDYCYVYNELNEQAAFRHIRSKNFNEALGIGSAYGDEFKPLISNIGQLTILDPSDAFAETNGVMGIPCQYLKPHPSGDMPFKSNRFDLISCLGVMHHIPNVSHVLGECYRCLNAGGIMLLREPITSMGDWRFPRQGLTRRERGIPLTIFDSLVHKRGFTVIRRTHCYFPVIPKLSNKVGIDAYNSRTITKMDLLLCRLFAWNTRYHRTHMLHKFGPASVYYILRK